MLEYLFVAIFFSFNYVVNNFQRHQSQTEILSQFTENIIQTKCFQN